MSERFQNKRHKILGNAYPNPPDCQGFQMKAILRYLQETKIFEGYVYCENSRFLDH